LREFSHGKYGVQDLIQRLLLKYGKHRPFKDDRLFEEMAFVSEDDNLGSFFKRYIAGKELPPLAECLGKVGLMLGKDRKVRENPTATEREVVLRRQWMGQN
jgi:predicted metalloprotease with PDZ domain